MWTRRSRQWRPSCVFSRDCRCLLSSWMRMSAARRCQRGRGVAPAYLHLRFEKSSSKERMATEEIIHRTAHPRMDCEAPSVLVTDAEG